jgi:hypothetical protein
MTSRLEACPSCSRHVRLLSPTCPFCGAAVANAFRSRRAASPPPPGLNRWELVDYRSFAAVAVGVTAAACVTSAAACSSSTTTASESSSDGTSESTSESTFSSSAHPVAAGAKAVTFPLPSFLPSSCTEGSYYVTDNIGAACGGDTVYILCDHGSLTQYDCGDPGGAWVTAASTDVTDTTSVTAYGSPCTTSFTSLTIESTAETSDGCFVNNCPPPATTSSETASESK